MKKLILASKSPRRKELLAMLPFEFSIEVSNVNESMEQDLPANEIVKSLAYQKANAVFKNNTDCIVLGSDTIVVCDGKILGKPHSKQQAREMMQFLRNKSHEVMTGVAILSEEKQDVFVNTSKVYFNDISDQEIEEYISTDEAYDKAGGYAIQGWAGKFISRIEGNYYTIMGLPLDEVYEKLKGYR